MNIKYQTRVYLHGLIGGFLNGVANGFILIVVDPEKFNVFQGGVIRLGVVMLLSGAFGFFTYMKEHPLPDPEKDIDAMSVAKIQVAAIRENTE